MKPEFRFWIKQLNTFSTDLTQMSIRIEKLILEENGKVYLYAVLFSPSLYSLYLLYKKKEMAHAWMNLSSSLVSYGGIERNPSLFM